MAKDNKSTGKGNKGSKKKEKKLKVVNKNTKLSRRSNYTKVKRSKNKDKNARDARIANFNAKKYYTYREVDSDESILSLGRIGDIAGVDKSNMKALVRANMVPTFDYDNYAYRGGFNRMQFPYHQTAISNVREYLFFTKPDLNILTPGGEGEAEFVLPHQISNDDFWIHMFKHYRRVMADLSVNCMRKSRKYDQYFFIPMLSNFVRSNLDLPGVSAETTETGSTMYGTNIQYRKTSLKSDENYDFSLDFIDIPSLDLYYFFKMWDQYATYKDLGMIGPRENIAKNNKSLSTGYYRINKVLHDQIAIYKFIVSGDDMETILYYAKLTGCFPKSVPRDTFGNFKGEGPLQYSIDWHAQFVEDMKPVILKEFNSICRTYFERNKTTDINSAYKVGDPRYYGFTMADMFDDNGLLDGRHMDHPYVHMVINEGSNEKDAADKYRFVLKWYNK